MTSTPSPISPSTSFGGRPSTKRGRWSIARRSSTPFHPKGRVGRAVVRALEGDLKGSVTDLEALASRYPEAYDARMFAGMLAMEDNDQRRALMNLEAYVALAPADEQPPMMRMAISQLKQEMAAPQQPQP